MLSSREVSQTRRAEFHPAIRFCTEQSPNIFRYYILWFQVFDGLHKLGPEAGAGAFPQPGALAGEGDVLAGEAPAEDVDGGHAGPVDFGDVPEVRGVGESVRENLGWALVELRNPLELRPESGLHCHPQTTIAREQLSQFESH